MVTVGLDVLVLSTLHFPFISSKVKEKDHITSISACPPHWSYVIHKLSKIFQPTIPQYGYVIIPNDSIMYRTSTSAWRWTRRFSLPLSPNTSWGNVWALQNKQYGLDHALCQMFPDITSVLIWCYIKLNRVMVTCSIIGQWSCCVYISAVTVT